MHCDAIRLFRIVLFTQLDSCNDLSPHFYHFQMLVSHFTKSLDSSAVDEFRNISKMFRDGTCNARAYYEHCESVLGEKFENIFPELLALLPDISKQQVSITMTNESRMHQ